MRFLSRFPHIDRRNPRWESEQVGLFWSGDDVETQKKKLQLPIREELLNIFFQET